MKIPTQNNMWTLISDLRSLAPLRPLTYGQSLEVAQMQADRLRDWIKADEPAVNLLWLRKQRAVPVRFEASYLVKEKGGLTTDKITGKLGMFVNENDPRLRQRFTLLHEFKHVLDWDHAHLLH